MVAAFPEHGNRRAVPLLEVSSALRAVFSGSYKPLYKGRTENHWRESFVRGARGTTLTLPWAVEMPDGNVWR